MKHNAAVEPLLELFCEVTDFLAEADKKSSYPSFESVFKNVKESYQQLTKADFRDFADQLQYYTISKGQ